MIAQIEVDAAEAVSQVESLVGDILPYVLAAAVAGLVFGLIRQWMEEEDDAYQGGEQLIYGSDVCGECGDSLEDCSCLSREMFGEGYAHNGFSDDEHEDNLDRMYGAQPGDGEPEEAAEQQR